MKLVVGLIGALGLAACSTGGGVAGVKQPSNATGLMLSSASADNVAQCLAQLYNVSADPTNDGFTVTPNIGVGLSYHVVRFADPLDRYNTRVDVVGETPEREGPVPSTCLLPTDRQKA